MVVQVKNRDGVVVGTIEKGSYFKGVYGFKANHFASGSTMWCVSEGDAHYFAACGWVPTLNNQFG